MSQHQDVCVVRGPQSVDSLRAAQRLRVPNLVMVVKTIKGYGRDISMTRDSQAYNALTDRVKGNQIVSVVVLSVL